MPSRVLAVLLAAALLAPACTSDDGSGRIEVVTGLYPLAMIASRVGGDRVDVTNVAPPGAEPHDVELTPNQVAEVERADVVLYIHGLQPALDAAVREGSGLDALSGVAGDDDPHIWLSPIMLAPVAERLAARLAEVDEAGAAAYRANADSLVRELESLHNEIKESLARCARTDLVTSHAAFGRFAGEYGLRQTAITGVDPEAEPSPRRIADVVAFVKQRGVTTVFAESADDKTAQTVAREAGAKVAVLDPAEVDRGTPYATVMRNNVIVLREALGCT